MEYSKRIVAAAVSVDGVIISMEQPKRHGDILENLFFFFNVAENVEKQMIQGFLTNQGKFVNRKAAMRIAKRAGQVDKNDEGTTLISEDLW